VTTFFTVFALVGGALLALQLVLGVLGASDFHLPGMDGHDADHSGEDASASDALNLLSFRALTAGALFFGLTGLAVQEAGLGLLALPAAVVVGVAFAAATAWVMRAMGGMESDGAERLEAAVGQSGTVYLGIPAGRAGRGKVHLTLGGRLVECQAQSEKALGTGDSVLVIDVVGPDLVEVIPSPQIGA
jgi:hypothetical protein